MNEEISDLRRKPDELDKKIAKRERDLRTQGAFCDVHASYLRHLKAQQIQLADRVETIAACRA